MGKFDEIRRIMKDFKGDVDGLANRKIEEIETAKARLNPTALKEELASLMQNMVNILNLPEICTGKIGCCSRRSEKGQR